MFYEDTNVTRVIGWCSWCEEALTQASSQRTNWAGPPDSPPSQTQVWSRGGLDSGSSLPLACKSATMSQKRASRSTGWGPKESPGQTRKMSMTDIGEHLKKKKYFLMAGCGYELCNNVMQLYQIVTSIRSIVQTLDLYNNCVCVETDLWPIGLHDMTQHEEGNVEKQSSNWRRLR